MPPPIAPKEFVLDLETGLALALAFSFMPIAQGLASYLLPKSISRKYYWIFVWGAYDVLTHGIIEGSFLYHCFFSYETIAITSDYPHPASLGNKGPYFLGYADRNYGSFYSQGPMARLWQEYAKADSRWGGADLTVISLELLTVFGAGPLAACVCYLIAKASNTQDTSKKALLDAKMWFVAVVLSTGELVSVKRDLVLMSSKLTTSAVWRIYDLCTRMVVRKFVSRNGRPSLPLALPVLLQHDLGMDPTLDIVRRISRAK